MTDFSVVCGTVLCRWERTPLSTCSTTHLHLGGLNLSFWPHYYLSWNLRVIVSWGTYEIIETGIQDMKRSFYQFSTLAYLCGWNKTRPEALTKLFINWDGQLMVMSTPSLLICIATVIPTRHQHSYPQRVMLFVKSRHHKSSEAQSYCFTNHYQIKYYVSLYTKSILTIHFMYKDITLFTIMLNRFLTRVNQSD